MTTALFRLVLVVAVLAAGAERVVDAVRGRA